MCPNPPNRPAGLHQLPRDQSTRSGARALSPCPPLGRCHSPHQPFHPSSAFTGDSVSTTRLRRGNQGGDPFKRANGIPGDPLRENSRRSRSPTRPAAASPLPAPPGRPEEGGGRGPGACEPASKRGDAGPAPAPRRRSPPSPPAPARRPPGPQSAARGAGSRSPASPGRAPREGEVAAAAAALTIAGRQALPGARVPMARTQGLDFTSISFCPVPPFSGPPLLRLLPVFLRLPLAWSLRFSLSSLWLSFSSSWSSSSPPPPSLQKERKV